MLRDAADWLGGFHDPNCTWFDMGSCTCGSVAGDDEEEYDDDGGYDDYDPTAGTGGW